jgi:hypothetical protein
VQLDERGSWRAGWAVRRDWPDGSHDFVALSATVELAERRLTRDAAYWHRSPYRPQYSLAEISGRDFSLHGRRRRCRAPDCPLPPAGHVRWWAE